MQMLLLAETSGMPSGNIITFIKSIDLIRYTLFNVNIHFRAVLGKDVHFVGMTLDESECMNRVKSRHDDQPEILEKIRVHSYIA